MNARQIRSCLTVAILGSHVAVLTAAQLPGGGQLEAPLERIAPAPGSDVRLLAQRTRDGRLLLTPNEGFFPGLGLTAGGPPGAPDIEKLNGGKSFSEVSGWNQGEAMEWGLWIERSGALDARLEVSQAKAADRFVLSLDGGEKRELPVSRGGAVSFANVAKGRHTLRLEKSGPGASAAKFHRLELEGPAARQGAVLRKRWRPAAAHTRFSSSAAAGDIRLWVMEMDASPGDLGFYSPITTPFGYYGPTWRPDGTVNTGFNFSLWSYGRGKQEPPIEQLSHLIAVGNPEAQFSGFGHEGTGVKIRGWEPLTGRQGQRQAIALRVEPGPKYDTYFSWFYASDEKRWRLFGAGRKFNQGRPLKSLWVGSFVEVPGPPQKQRTGPYPRRMRYRGWVMDAQGRWSPLDRMRNGNVDKRTGLTHTDRGLKADGRFYLETGGWEFRKPNPGPDVVAPPDHSPLPGFMQPAALRPLLGMPSEIGDVKARRSGGRIALTFLLRNAGGSPKVTVFHGPAEGLTFADRWRNKVSVPAPREGLNKVVLPAAPVGGPWFARVLLENAEGKFWSDETAIAR